MSQAQILLLLQLSSGSSLEALKQKIRSQHKLKRISEAFLQPWKVARGGRPNKMLALSRSGVILPDFTPSTGMYFTRQETKGGKAINSKLKVSIIIQELITNIIL